MTIPSNVARAVLVGTAPGGEIFETGFWMKVNSALTLSNVNDLATDLAAKFGSTARLPLAKLIYSDTTYRSVKVYGYPSGGPTATYVGEDSINGGGGSGPGTMPLYVCMVASLRTGVSGRSYRGRMYLPANGAQLAVSHRWEGTLAADACNGLAAFFQAINGSDTPAGAQVVTLSQKLGTWLEVNEVSVDAKPDVQRRRENKMDAGTIAVAVV